METLSIKYINSLCTKYEKITGASMLRGQYGRAERFLKALSYLQYKFFLGYKNVYIEQQIQNIAKQIKKVPFIDNKCEKSIVIIDEICADYIGLMLQYMEPLIVDSYRILYLYEQVEHAFAPRTHLMHMLQTYDKAVVKQIPQYHDNFSKSQWVYNEICAFGAKKVIMNFGEWPIELSVACAALPEECKRYRINAGDHCFWAGVCCTDYTFEFRQYGANLTNRRRGLQRDGIIYIPYYPIMLDVPFEGIPNECSGKFVFFSGGAIYKIVDEQNTYFKLCREIIDVCPGSVILFAGAHADNDLLKNGIEQYGLQGKFIPIGYRKDIVEVVKRCDVYINTYPLGGGMMCQYAAQYYKPILNYKNNAIEECVAQKSNCSFTSYSEQELVSEALKLYTEADYRKKKGEAIHNAAITKDEFDHALLLFLSKGKPSYEVKWMDNFVEKKYSIDDAILYCNKKLAAFYYKLYHLLGLDFILTMPCDFLSLGMYGVKWKIERMLHKKS